jgi:peptidyl-prolyl cis-trans isomerase B (cyclophilin B)
METSAGTIEFRMRPDQAPNTVWSFLELCRGGFYTDVGFHRIAPMNATNHAPFVIQGGDPIFGHGQTGVGEGGPGFTINLEQTGLPHDFGVISMARNPRFPNSAGSQFFICLSREGTAHLDGKFAAFGQAVSGAEVIRAIAETPIASGDHPAEPVVIRRCALVDAPPHGEGPPPVGAPAPRPIDR